jgi:hypothetical protein
MSTDRDVTRIVRSWLEEGATALPDRVLDAVLDQVPATPQRRAWWPARRLPDMNTLSKVLIAVAAVVIVVIAGLYFLPRDGGVGAPAPIAAPTPSPIALTEADLARPLSAGTYRTPTTFAVPFAITVPSNWTMNGLSQGKASFAGVGSSVEVHVVEGIFVDPCKSESPAPKPATVDDYVDALTTMVGFQASPVTDDEIGGRAVKAVTITNSIDTATADCREGQMLPLWMIKGGETPSTNGGATQHLWVADVDGTIVVIVGEGDRDPVISSISFD